MRANGIPSYIRGKNHIALCTANPKGIGIAALVDYALKRAAVQSFHAYELPISTGCKNRQRTNTNNQIHMAGGGDKSHGGQRRANRGDNSKAQPPFSLPRLRTSTKNLPDRVPLGHHIRYNTHQSL